METVSKVFQEDGIDYEFFGIEGEHIFKQVPWYERKLLDYIRGLNLQGEYIDVGGNIGNHSLFFLNHCPSTKVYIFEPEDLCYSILETNLKGNTKKEYESFNCAAWDKEAVLKLVRFESTNNTGLSHVEEGDGGNIFANSLDNLIPWEARVVLLKVDTEGSETKVLQGAINLIKSNYPTIVCEAATTEEFEEINNILVPLGYSVPAVRFNATPTYVWRRDYGRV
jgi:FkbM family methyltransferase